MEIVPISEDNYFRKGHEISQETKMYSARLKMNDIFSMVSVKIRLLIVLHLGKLYC